MGFRKRTPLVQTAGVPIAPPAGSAGSGLWKSRPAALVGITFVILVLSFAPAYGREKNGVDYGAGLIINVPFPLDQVLPVVEDVTRNGIIRGTKEYNKDPYISGATTASSTRLFPKWTEGGHVLYKLREHALDPRNFYHSGDVGTVIVRYVVQPQGDKHTVIKINAIFVEDFRRTVHQSDGSVESAEYKDIHDRLDQISTMNEETAELQREKKEFAAQKAGTPGAAAGYSSSLTPGTAGTPVQEVSLAEAKATADTVPQNLPDRVKQLRHEVERIVRAPGAALKSAPFHSATTLQSLPPGAEVLIVINTTYWFGVETHDGQHGWILRDELELTP